jgi:hypothetical protein
LDRPEARLKQTESHGSAGETAQHPAPGRAEGEHPRQGIESASVHGATFRIVQAGGNQAKDGAAPTVGFGAVGAQLTPKRERQQCAFHCRSFAGGTEFAMAQSLSVGIARIAFPVQGQNELKRLTEGAD